MKISLSKAALNPIQFCLTVLPVSLPATKSKKTKKKSAKSTTPFQSYSESSQRELKLVDKSTNGLVATTIKRDGFSAKSSKGLDISYPKSLSSIQSIRLFGLGEKPTEESFRLMGGDAYKSAKRTKANKVCISLNGVSGLPIERAVKAVVEGWHLAAYDYTRYKGESSSSKKDKSPTDVVIITSNGTSKTLSAELRRAGIIAQATTFARDLVNTPPSDLDPAHLVREARKIASRRGSGVKARIFNEAALKKMRANLLLSVGAASANDCFLIHLSYTPRKKVRGRKVLALVGKGITFDSGGLSIKTGKGMEEMKMDMAGAACVLSVMKAISELPAAERPEHEIHVIVPTTENLISTHATKPGDIVRGMNGKTVEILNTDAEGRLILADALAYTERVKPDVIIDLATLTGAVIAALGSDYAGLFSNNPELTKLLIKSGKSAGEALWELPLADEYRYQVESPVANLKNIGSGGPGAIMGALFLEEFVPADTAWAHLDIAGTAYVSRGNAYTKPGGTGFGVRTLLNLIDEVDSLATD